MAAVARAPGTAAYEEHAHEVGEADFRQINSPVGRWVRHAWATRLAGGASKENEAFGALTERLGLPGGGAAAEAAGSGAEAARLERLRELRGCISRAAWVNGVLTANS